MNKFVFCILFFFCAATLPNVLSGQINLRYQVKNRLNSPTYNIAEEGINKSLDKVEDGNCDLFKKDKTDGTGKTRNLASNDTPVFNALIRRADFIKLENQSDLEILSKRKQNSFLALNIHFRL